VRGTEAHPIDYANASPDVAITSLHHYFPWAIKALLRWCVFCVVTDRVPRLDLDTRRYFEIGDRADLTYQEKLASYRKLADEYFEVERYQDFCDSRIPHVDEMVSEWVASPEFDDLLVETGAHDLPAARARAVRRALARAHHCLTAQSWRRSMRGARHGRRTPGGPSRSLPSGPFRTTSTCRSAPAGALPASRTSQCRSAALPLDRENGSGSQLAGSSITYWCASSRRVLVGEGVVGQAMQPAR